jgi:hypothetical protein
MAATGENAMTESKGSEAASIGATGTPAGGTQYEFQAAENALISNLAWKMHFVGLFSISIGLLIIALGVVMVHIGPIFTGTYSTLLGLWTQRASMSFKSIVETQGNDVSHLLHALEDLKRLYSLQFWLCVLTLAIAVVALVWIGLKLPGYSAM